MLSASTPFKILNDENSHASTTLKKTGLKQQVGANSVAKHSMHSVAKVSFENSSNTPLGKGPAMSAAKSQRKALSSLSTSQVNARILGPSTNTNNGHAVKVYAEENIGSKTSEKMKKASLSSCSVQPEDMVCSHPTVDEDIYDEMLRKANSAHRTKFHPVIDYSKDYMEESLMALDDIQWDRPEDQDIFLTIESMCNDPEIM